MYRDRVILTMILYGHTMLSVSVCFVFVPFKKSFLV